MRHFFYLWVALWIWFTKFFYWVIIKKWEMITNVSITESCVLWENFRQCPGSLFNLFLVSFWSFLGLFLVSFWSLLQVSFWLCPGICYFFFFNKERVQVFCFQSFLDLMYDEREGMSKKYIGVDAIFIILFKSYFCRTICKHFGFCWWTLWYFV